METKKIEELSVIEIKAMVYDELSTIEKCKHNISFLNGELSRRSEQPVVKQEDVNTSK